MHEGDLSDLLQNVPVSEAAKTAVVNRMQEPHRHYHNLDHPVEMWCWHRQFAQAVGEVSSQWDQTVASFCLYHDVIYDPRTANKDNECQSAALWMADAQTAIGARFLVYECILASAHHFRRNRYQQPVLHWCLDLDLLRLAAPFATFIQQGHDIRAEYHHLTDQQWAKKSSEFRSSVMAQSKIFMCAALANSELRARKNLASALQQDWQALGYLD